MTDYGHELVFGSFVTPTAARPQDAVGLAQLSENVGLDLVTFQDHPYQPGFLDTWTLLSFVAARTGVIRLAANVTNLPLRPPAVLARSAASLDLLSNGRFELGLGAGAFWDAIEAMGARRLRPGDAVQALEEALAIIRGTWDVDDHSLFRVDGEFHHVRGAKRGPAPAHDIEIWLGAYKPRMLRVTGARADGWLPSLGYVELADLAAGNAIIDEAAVAAGRRPADVRRMLNLNAEYAPEQLAELTLRDGISTFILGGDDPDALERFARDTAPAVRELVSVGRAPATSSPPAVTPVLISTPTAGEFDRLGITPTPDSGVRLSATRLWDETARPTRPASGADVTYTQQGRAVGRQLVEVHDHLRQELTRVRSLVDQVRSGTVDAGQARSMINEMTVRQNEWTLGAYCASYCRLVAQHHGLEDQAVFPHLRSRDVQLEPVIDRLAEEHEIIHEVLEQVDRALVDLVAHPQDFSALTEAVDVLTDSLLSHLSYEERELIEPLARLGFYPGQV